MKRAGFVWMFAGWLLASLGLVSAVAAQGAKVDPLDWPYWRGPEGNSISRETGLPDTINPGGGEGSNLAWKRDDLGARSTPIVLRGKIYYLARHNPATPKECEKVVCLNAETGATIWESIHNVWSSDVPDTRVGWSSVVGDPATGNVFSMGANGLFQCLDGETGKTIWQIPLHEQFGVLTTYGGRTNSPVIFEDLVILGSVIIGWGEMAVPAHRILAFDKSNGQVVWFISTRLRPEDTIYNNPTIATIKGQKLLITGSGDGYVYAFQPRTGKKVWEYEFSRRGLNLTPTVDGDVIYMGHSEENRKSEKDPALGRMVGAVVALDGTQEGNVTEKAEIWKSVEIADGKSSILKVGDRLYCPDDAGKLFILDAKTGQEVCKKVSLGTINFGAPVYADGKIYHCEKNGRWYILKPSDEGVERPARGKTLGNFPTGDECWASPVVSHGRLYILTTGALYCFEDKAKTKGSTPQPKQPEETPVAEDQTPAQALIVPAEVLMRPGEKQSFTVKLYNSRGQFLKTSDAKFEVDANGQITEKGEFTAAADGAHVAAFVTATVGDLKARARIRIVPPLPWKFDFEGLTDAPITWIGARYRHQLRKVDGNSLLAKITTIPKGTRSRASLGQSDLHDYTIQADMLPFEADGKQPDMGVIAQGYTFEVSGERNLVQIGSWISHDKRYFATKPFKIEGGKWYTLKLQAANVDGTAVVKAKVWKKEDKEPADWTLELVDPQPNKEGAPGLFGNATNAEVHIDNLTVTPNS
ncbi:outer membrane biogenesis protein BamB [Anatilimnocola aggregata]|uniref:Outer membrane biogenesis protein BamB n=1 Tax=Anatilimnocola aggregata TaxID=2528021 RepID=A0A517Y4A2_9BACT|nr:PQQ-binding-like beta-propeller repeat protein [Anatilimnocola aggregata]QDU25089.1 outer membrane biogenesis protein BamB [Anatilimnocola aggregata]